MLHAKIFYPINLNPLAFILIMGVRLRANTFEKFRLEKLLRLRDIRWHSLLENMQLIVLELDTEGRVRYINPFGVQILGYSSPNEIMTKDWFSNYLPVHEAGNKISFCPGISWGRKCLIIKMIYKQHPKNGYS